MTALPSNEPIAIRVPHQRQAGDHHIDGKLIVDGETSLMRDVEWLLRRDDAGDSMARFVCTLVLEPAESCS